MRPFAGETSDGLRVLGLHSPSAVPGPTVLHVHGYGGDFLSNTIVRECHDALPRRGIGFASVNLRSSGYLGEVYAEESVRYVGSAVVDHDDVSRDVEAAICSLDPPAGTLILQGHSFGTNVVKAYARDHPGIARIVLLSPADSMALYRNWLATAPRNRAAASDDRDIRWDLFGMAAGSSSYEIPISLRARDALLNGRVFHEWSSAHQPVLQDALVVIGAVDPISAVGTTADDAAITAMLPNCSIGRVRGARHLFTGYESEVCDLIAAWVLDDAGPSADGGWSHPGQNGFD